MAHASFPGTDKHGKQILLPIPQTVGLRAGREPGSCNRRAERFCSCAEVRDRGLSSAEKAKCLVQLLPLCAGPHAGGRWCRASQTSNAPWARPAICSLPFPPLSPCLFSLPPSLSLSLYSSLCLFSLVPSTFSALPCLSLTFFSLLFVSLSLPLSESKFRGIGENEAESERNPK